MLQKVGMKCNLFKLQYITKVDLKTWRSINMVFT